MGTVLLLTWAVIKQGTPVTLEGLNKTQPYRLDISKRDFTTDIVNATLLLINLTWSKTIKNFKDIKIPVVLNNCNTSTKLKDCKRDQQKCYEPTKACMVEISCEVIRSPIEEIRYPTNRLRISPSPFARLAQPTNTTNSFPYLFQAALPEMLESPFDVTSKWGIVYMTDWSVRAMPHTLASPGMLVEWMSVKDPQQGIGLAWLDVTVSPSDCTSWGICSEARSHKACERPCRAAASPFQKGRCEWRENTEGSIMTRKYATCSPDLSYCPDKVCDPLETLHVGICSQDCTKNTVGLGSLIVHEGGREQGIGSGRGTCSCDDTGSCHCGVEVANGRPPGVGKKPQEEEEAKEQPLEPPKLTAVQEVTQEKGTCDVQCISIIVSTVTALAFFLAAIIYLSTLRSCTIRKKTNEGMEYSGHALLPLSNIEGRTTTPITETLIHHYDVDPKWEVSRSKLVVEECLGEGEFGRVLKANARDLPNNPGFLTVAVKTLKENASSSELEDLMSEYQLLKEVSHPNVIKLLGACTTPGAPVYIIIEYCALGSLRAYLRRHRNIMTASERLSFQNVHSEITPHDILSCAWQISKGMAYLTEIKLVHRDLAARNILLATGKVCKISDFGLTRDVYEDDTYLKKSRGRVPVKWMALESLSDHVYTSKSDVWSFGIVLWELVTLGSSPYPGVAVQNLYHLLKTGYRMQKPGNCSEQLYNIMKDCWSASPSERPSFPHLVTKFERMLEDGADYLDCSLNMVSNPTYFSSLPRQAAPGGNQMDNITFKMDFDDEDEDERLPAEKSKYENESVNKNTSYDTPKPISSIIMSDLLVKDEQR